MHAIFESKHKQVRSRKTLQAAWQYRKYVILWI